MQLQISATKRFWGS